MNKNGGKKKKPSKNRKYHKTKPGIRQVIRRTNPPQGVGLTCRLERKKIGV